MRGVFPSQTLPCAGGQPPTLPGSVSPLHHDQRPALDPLKHHLKDNMTGSPTSSPRPRPTRRPITTPCTRPHAPGWIFRRESQCRRRELQAQTTAATIHTAQGRPCRRPPTPGRLHGSFLARSSAATPPGSTNAKPCRRPDCRITSCRHAKTTTLVSVSVPTSYDTGAGATEPTVPPMFVYVQGRSRRRAHQPVKHQQRAPRPASFQQTPAPGRRIALGPRRQRARIRTQNRSAPRNSRSGTTPPPDAISRLPQPPATAGEALDAGRCTALAVAPVPVTASVPPITTTTPRRTRRSPPRVLFLECAGSCSCACPLRAPPPRPTIDAGQGLAPRPGVSATTGLHRMSARPPIQTGQPAPARCSSSAKTQPAPHPASTLILA